MKPQPGFLSAHCHREGRKPVAIHCEPVSEETSRPRPPRHDGLPRPSLRSLLAMTILLYFQVRVFCITEFFRLRMHPVDHPSIKSEHSDFVLLQ